MNSKTNGMKWNLLWMNGWLQLGRVGVAFSFIVVGYGPWPSSAAELHFVNSFNWLHSICFAFSFLCPSEESNPWIELLSLKDKSKSDGREREKRLTGRETHNHSLRNTKRFSIFLMEEAVNNQLLSLIPSIQKQKKNFYF